MNSRFSKIIALVLIQCQFAMMLPAEELRVDLSRGLARLEHYLDRAAAERRTQDWEQLARAGLEAAMYEWESGALWLLEEDAEAWREERSRAELSYRKETEAAYVRWASDRVYTERAGFENSELETLLREAAAEWNYGEAGRIVSMADAERARSAWEQVAGEIVDRCLDAWEERQGLAYVELEGRFQDLGLSDEERRNLIRGVAEERRAMISREYGRIALAEGNRLIAELLYDQGSMKKLASAEAASVIARELAQEAEAATERQTGNLFAELDTLFSAEEDGGIELNAADWLNQFRNAFEEGLARWEEAELGFLAARAEWEHDAEDAYLAGEETWNNAYLELTSRQKAWETAILLKLDEGFAKWQENQSRLNTEIETARNEFLAASEENRRVKEKMLNSQAEIYIRSRQMMDIVRRGIESWRELWDEKYLMVYTLIKQAAATESIVWLHPGYESPPVGQSLEERFRDLDENLYKNLINDSINIDELTNPGKNNVEILWNQIELLKEACLVMKERNWSLPLSIEELMSSAGELFDGETGWFSLALRYRDYADTATERLYRLAGSTGEHIEGYTGELRTELLKAEALLGYWDDELAVAEALNQYAQETSSIIEDAARTREELENARLAYEETVKNYERAVEFSREKGLLLDKAQEKFEETQAALAGLRAAVEEAQQDYTNVLAAIQQMNPAPFYDELANLALAILGAWEGKTESGGEAAGAKSIGESILEYYRLSLDYTDILRSMEINSLLESLESGSGLAQPGIDSLYASAEEARVLSQPGREEGLRAAAGLYPADISLSIRWGEAPGEVSLFESGRDLIIALDQAYRETAVPEEREILLTLMRQTWNEAALWYEDEIRLRKQSIEYLKTGILPEVNVEAGAELRVHLEGLLAALRITLIFQAPGSGPEPGELTDMITIIENILSRELEGMAEALEEAARENPVFADAMEGLFTLPTEAYAAAWIAQRQAKRNLGLLNLEQVQLITDRYGAYNAENINRLNREAREAVAGLIAAFSDGSRNTAGKERALEYAAELRDLGQGLNQVGQEALNSYIAAFLEFAAVQDYRRNPADEPELSALLNAYTDSMAAYEVYSSWQYKIYDDAGLAEIAGSGEFSMLGKDKRDEFILYASSTGYTELTAWAAEILSSAYSDLMAKADALIYGQYYRQEKEDSRFSWTAGLADCREKMFESGIGNETLEKIDPLFSSGAVDRALEGLKNKALWLGAWFTGEDEWNYAQYQEDAGEAPAESARIAMEKGWNEFQGGITLDTGLYAMAKAELDRLQYINKGVEELNRIQNEKKVVLDRALEAYNTYLDRDYDLAVNALDQSCTDYNAAVDRADKYYEKMTDARLQMRKRQEILDWASSVYLKDFGTSYEENYLTPLEKLSQIRYARERALAAVEVLNEILNGTSPRVDTQYGQAMEAYKESRRKYYLGQVTAYEEELALARQKAVVREAELAEEAARRKLITNTGSIVPSGYELVSLSVDGNGTYKVELAYTLQNIYLSDIIGSHDPDRPGTYGTVIGNTAVRKAGAGDDSEIFSRYFGDDTAVPVERVDAEEYISMAEYEAGEWLKRIGTLGIAYYDDVMLASLYIRYCAAEGSAEGNEWFKGISDPRTGGNYRLGDIPLDFNIRGFDLRSEYNSARRKVLQDAYNRVMAGEGGEEDIARYLLYRNRNIIGNAASYEEDLLKVRAAEIVDRAMGETHRNYTVAFNVAMGLGAALTAVGAGLTVASILNLGCIALARAAFAAAAVAFTTAGVLDHVRNQINGVQASVRGLLIGLDQNLNGDNGYNTQFNNNYSQWKQSLAYLSQERKVLNLMMYGTEDKPAEEGENSELSYENFRTGLSMLLNTGTVKTAISYDESIGLYSRELFDASNAKTGSTVGGAIKLINSSLEREAGEQKERLDAESERLKAGQEQSIGLYYGALVSSLPIPQDRQAELRALALRAGDPSLDIAERRNAALEYERLVSELCGGTGDTRKEIANILGNAFGDGSWNSEWHAANLIGLEGELFDFRTVYARTAETYTEQEIVLLIDSILAALDQNSTLALSVKEREWALLTEDFLSQYRSWQEQVEQIRQAGLSEWQKARVKMNEGYYSWQKRFSDEYQAKTGAWDLNYLEFVNEKQKWVDEQYIYAVNVRNAGLFDYTGTDAAQIIEQTLAWFSVERFNRETFDPAAYTDMLLEDSILGELLSRLDGLGGRAELGRPGVRTEVRRTSAAGDLARAAKILDMMSADMRKASAKLAVQEAQKIIDEAIQHFWDRLASENKAVWEWEEHLVQANGYRTDGEIRRQAIVDSTITGTITRTQTVHRYQDYVPSSPPGAGVDLNAALMRDLDADTILRFVQTAHWNLDKWGETIFGRLDDNGNMIEHRIPRGFGELSAGAYAKTASAEKDRVDDLKAKMDRLEAKGFEALSNEEKKEYESLANQLVTVRDGELGAHIGYGPLLKDEVNYRHSPVDDALDLGAGEMGKIMLDFMWNSRVNTAGYMESFKSMYDQKFWADEFIPGLSALGIKVESPTLRGVADIAGNIASLVVSSVLSPAAGSLVGLIDDVLFAGFDIGIGYQDTGDVLRSLAAAAGNSAMSTVMAGFGNSEIFKNMGAGILESMTGTFGETTSTVLYKTLSTTASSYTSTAAVNLMQSFNPDTGEFDFGAFAKSLYSTETLAGTLSAMAASGLGAYAGTAMSLSDQKLYGGLVNIAAAGAGETARYGVYALDSMVNGGGNFMNRLAQAYDNMGGITLNIANLGSMLDFMGTLSYRLGENYDTRLGTLGGQLSGAGLLELALGRDGASLALGMNGIDVAGGLYSSIKHGLDYTALKYGNYGGSENRDVLISNYLNGDWIAENTSMRIKAGSDILRILNPETLGINALGKTTRLESGSGRLITIADMENINSNAILLQHESYRDGYITGGNTAETIDAVIAHTLMAAGMMQGNVDFQMNRMLFNDLMVYYGTGGDMAAFTHYMLENYDSSGDYWKLTEEGNLEYDGFATLRDADGNVIKSYSAMGLKSDQAVESALLYILGIDSRDSEKVSAVRKLMMDSGIIHSPGDDPSSWSWTGDHIFPKQEADIQTALLFDKPFLWSIESPILQDDGSPLGTIARLLQTEVSQDLTALNMGKTITLNSIAGLYGTTGSDRNSIERFVNNTYGSAIGFLNYANTGNQTSTAAGMLSKYLASDELEMVKTNQKLFNDLLSAGQNIQTSMFTGSVSQTQAFGVTSDYIPLKGSSYSFLVEDHPAIDFAGGGKTITTPGGFWVYDGKNGYNAIFSLYGGDLRMRINHVNTGAITYSIDEIIGAASESKKLLDYPDKLYGTGSGTHVHIEYTLNLPYGSEGYTRQFVNPNTLLPNQDYLDYYLKYYDKDKKLVKRTGYNRMF